MFSADSPKVIYHVEFSKPAERALRYALIGVGGYLFYAYDGNPLGIIWATAHVLMHTLLYLATRYFYETRSPAVDALIFFLSAMSMFSFLWFPAWEVVHGSIVGVYAGSAIIVCCFLYALSRNDRSATSLALWTLSGALTASFIGFEMITRGDSIVHILGVTIASGTMLGYFIFSMRTSMELRKQTALAAERTAQEQKLASIGRLAGGVAHDFNNALTGISGNIELYFELDDPAEKEELLHLAQDSAARAARLVQQLLVFSRQSGLDPVTARAADMVQEAADFQRRLLPANITLEVLANDPALIQVDRHLVVTALINLAINAVDAMPEGGRLVIAAQRDHLLEPAVMVDGRSLPKGPYVRLSVQDTGTGIPRHLLPRVVEPFFSTKPVGKGSGLGLSMVVGLAQRLDGGVEIDTGISGTTVSVLLPAAPVEAELHPEALEEVLGGHMAFVLK